MVEVSCHCNKPKYFIDSGNDEEAKILYIDRILGRKEQTEPKIPGFGKREKFTEIGRKQRETSSNIEDYFIEDFTPRQIQVELWKEIQSLINSGYKKIILCAPTGVGKSFLAAAIAKKIGTSFIVTSTKGLQDQYASDISEYYSVKGKSNFACYKIMGKKKVPLEDTDQAMKKYFTCNYGSCYEYEIINGIEKMIPCKYKPDISELEENGSKTNDCLYYAQKYLGLISAHSLWNYASYFQIIKQRKRFEKYLERGIAIFDEAHKIEEQIIQFIEIKIKDEDVQECEISINPNSLEDNIDNCLAVLEKMVSKYAQIIHTLKLNESDPDKLSRFDDKLMTLKTGIGYISKNKDNFIVNKPEINKNGEFRSISIKPLHISEYVKEYFQNPVEIFMSATIDKENFCKSLGFEPENVGFVDTPKSPFAIQNRTIAFENIASLKRGSPIQDKIKVWNRINEILNQNSNQRGLVLTSSKEKCKEIFQNVSLENQNRIIIWHSTDFPKKTIEEVISEHVKNPNSVLLSSSLWEGIDLKDDLSRFQIIEKTPYPGQSDKRVKIMKDSVFGWYDSQTRTKLLQGFGRSIRNEKDWANTHVLDSMAQVLLNKNKQLVPKAYHDILGWN